MAIGANAGAKETLRCRPRGGDAWGVRLFARLRAWHGMIMPAARSAGFRCQNSQGLLGAHSGWPAGQYEMLARTDTDLAGLFGILSWPALSGRLIGISPDVCFLIGGNAEGLSDFPAARRRSRRFGLQAGVDSGKHDKSSLELVGFRGGNPSGVGMVRRRRSRRVEPRVAMFGRKQTFWTMTGHERFMALE